MTPITYDRLQEAGWTHRPETWRSSEVWIKGRLRCDGLSVWTNDTFDVADVSWMEDLEAAERNLK